MIDELDTMIGIKLAGKIINEKKYYQNKETEFNRYVLLPESFIELRKLLGSKSVRIIMPSSFYSQEINPSRVSIVLDEEFTIIHIYEG